MIRSYPKVFNLGHAAMADLLGGNVVVQEKVDGSQFSFARTDSGQLLFRSKGAEIHPEAPPKLFEKGVEAVKAIRHKLSPGKIYRGEYLEKPKHNNLAYGRVPKGHIILFDIEDQEMDQRFAVPPTLVAEAERLDMEATPMIYFGLGAPLSFARLEEWMALESCLGGQKIEGVVIKAYGRFGKDGKTLMGKHVSEAYKETHKSGWKVANPSKGDVIAALIGAYRTDARWEKAVQHLRDDGKLDNSPKDIGPLLGELAQDIHAECGEEIRERLYKWAMKGIMRGVQAGFAEWYKNRLARSQFEAASSEATVLPEVTDAQ